MNYLPDTCPYCFAAVDYDGDNIRKFTCGNDWVLYKSGWAENKVRSMDCLINQTVLLGHDCAELTEKLHVERETNKELTQEIERLRDKIGNLEEEIRFKERSDADNLP